MRIKSVVLTRGRWWFRVLGALIESLLLIADKSLCC